MRRIAAFGALALTVAAAGVVILWRRGASPRTYFEYAASVSIADDTVSLTAGRDCANSGPDFPSLTAGSGLVLAVKRFDPGDPGLVDDEGFEHLFLVLPDATTRGTVEVKPEGVRIHYARGIAAWTRHCFGPWIRTATGSVSIQGAGSGELRANLNVRLPVVGEFPDTAVRDQVWTLSKTFHEVEREELRWVH